MLHSRISAPYNLSVNYGVRLVLCSNVQQNGHIIIECYSKWLVWQRRKNIFVSLQEYCRFYSLCRLHLLYLSQFSTSEEDAGIRVLSSCRPTNEQFYFAAIPWTFTYRSLPPLVSVPAFMQASNPCSRLPTDPFATSCGCVVVLSRISGVRRGRIQGLALFERMAEHIPHLCQQDCICNRLTLQRSSTSVLIKRNNRNIWRIILETSIK